MNGKPDALLKSILSGKKVSSSSTILVLNITVINVELKLMNFELGYVIGGAMRPVKWPRVSIEPSSRSGRRWR